MSSTLTILGVDFTSAPKARKPITCVRMSLDGRDIEFEALERWNSFHGFEQMLAADGPWIAGIDFPFGQARRFVENVGWPDSWAAYAEKVGTLDRTAFRELLEDYKAERPAGDKQHKRRCDVLSRSQSPQTLYGTPVSLMFFEGAPRLQRAGVHLPHNRDGDRSRTVLEAYPGVAARLLIGDRSYKNDTKRKQTSDQALARQGILSLLCGDRGKEIYRLSVSAPATLADDPGADDLDALLCAVQAAWGWTNRDKNFGAPDGWDQLEGWIADPALLRALESG